MIEALTYNVEYGKRLPEVYAWLSDLPSKPDIVCLQEFPKDQISTLRRLGLYDRFGYHFAPAQTHKGAVYGQLTAYDKEKLVSRRARYIDLGEHRLERIYRRLSPSRRSALFTTFHSIHGVFTMVNIHLVAVGTNAHRRGQLARILREVNGDPTVILGDYNYTDLIAGDGLARYLGAYGFQKAGEKMRTHRYRMISQQLDYVFYSDCTVENVRMESVPYSDHYPVFARVVL